MNFTLFSKPDYRELYAEQVKRNTEMIQKIGELLQENKKLHNELLDAKAETISALNGFVFGLQLKQKSTRKPHKFLYSQSADELIAKAIDALVKYGDNLPQGVLLSAMNRNKADRTGIKILHEGVDKFWSVRREGNQYLYSLKKE